MAKTKTKSKKPYKRNTPQDRSTVLYIHGLKSTFAHAKKMGSTKFRGFSNYVNWLIAKDMGDKKAVAKLTEIAKTFEKNKTAPKAKSKVKAKKVKTKAVAKKATKKVAKKTAAPAKARIKAKKPKLAAVPQAVVEPSTPATEPQQTEQVA